MSVLSNIDERKSLFDSVLQFFSWNSFIRNNTFIIWKKHKFFIDLDYSLQIDDMLFIMRILVSKWSSVKSIILEETLIWVKESGLSPIRFPSQIIWKVQSHRELRRGKLAFLNILMLVILFWSEIMNKMTNFENL